VPAVHQQMQQINHKLCRVLELIQQQESGPVRVTDADLARLLSELQKAEQIRATATRNGDELCSEFVEYRRNLEDLRVMLPKLQARYSAERARLQHDHSHLQAANGWAQTQEMLQRR